jgi:hypothetical protein
VDDESTLPAPTPEVLETLRLAERIASDVASREQFRMLRELLERPNRPSAREAAGQLSGEGTLTARVVILADGAVGTEELTVVKSSSDAGGSTSTATVEAAKTAAGYALKITAWGGAFLVVAKVIHEASDIVLSWWTASGR